MKNVNGHFGDNQYLEAEGIVPVPPGLTLQFNKVDAQHRDSLYAFISSVFSVSLIESPRENLHQVVDLDGNATHYYAHPYEYFCRENLSFFAKLLRSIKMGEGLHFLLKDFGYQAPSGGTPLAEDVVEQIVTSEYRALRAKATKDKF